MVINLDIFLKFYFIFKLYIIVLVLPNIKMNPPQVYMCSIFWEPYCLKNLCNFNLFLQSLMTKAFLYFYVTAPHRLFTGKYMYISLGPSVACGYV